MLEVPEFKIQHVFGMISSIFFSSTSTLFQEIGQRKRAILQYTIRTRSARMHDHHHFIEYDDHGDHCHPGLDDDVGHSNQFVWPLRQLYVLK